MLNQTAKTLRESREYLQIVLDSTKDAVFVEDPQTGQILDVNSRICEMYGYTQEEVLSIPISDMSQGSPPYAQADALAWHEKARKLGPQTFEWRAKHKNGELFWVEVTLRFVTIETAERLVVSVRDITKRKRFEESLKHNEAELLGILDTTVDGILAVNRQGKVIKTNRRFVDMWRIPEAIMAGGDDQVLVNHVMAQLTDPDAFLEKVLALYDSNEHDIDTLYFKDGRVFERNSAPLMMDGSSVGRVWSFHDVTEHKRSEQALRNTMAALTRSNELLEQFASVMSHDLKEPLRMVTGFMGLLKEQYKGKIESKADEYIAFASNAAERMQGLIDDLLAYSHVGTKNVLESVVVGEALAQAMSNLQLRIEETGCTITRDPLPSIRANGTELTLVFQNLIGNAIKFRGDRKPTIHIGARRDGDRWNFTVKDNGIGIAPEHKERIFLIFQRLHTAEEYPGSGMGLAICKNIVERHAGRIWVESEPGAGSTFFFTIPG